MAPPLLPLRHYTPTHVTEDTPPDLLEGTMDLEVTLPNGQTVIMTVHRSTPMMDLLIQVTTAHRINPGGHVIQVISDNIFLSYKPSTPIGTMDTNAIKIVAKNTLNEKAKTRKSNLQQQAIERNIRLKPKEWVYKQQLVVNLPRNQLAVYRVRPKALVSEIFSMVCEDKNLDQDTHEIRHPVNVDERLRGSCSLSDYQLQEVCVVSSDFRPPPLSVTDLITMSSIAHPEDKKRRGIFGLFSRKAKSSTGDSSLSSGSAGERSVSPARSDESNEGRPVLPQAHSPTSSSSGTLTNNNHKTEPSVTATASTSQRNSFNSADSSSSRLSRPVSMISLNKNKKRQAPVPPQRVKRTTEGQRTHEKLNGSKEKPSLSRHSSDSSGYHEQDVRSSQSPSNSDVGNLDVTKSSLPQSSNLSSVSSSSVSSLKGGKRKAPCPPKPPSKSIESPVAIPESPEELESNESLKEDNASDRKSISSFVDKPSNSDVTDGGFEESNEDVEVNVIQVSHSKEITPAENLPSDGESSSSRSEHDTSNEMKDAVVEIHEISPSDKQSLPKSNGSHKDNELETSKKLFIDKSMLETCEFESPSPSLVMSELTSNQSSSQTLKATQSKSCVTMEENRALPHPDSKLTAFSPNQTGNELNITQSMSASPKTIEMMKSRDSQLTSNFPDRLKQSEHSHAFSKSTIPKDSTNIKSDSKTNTFPRTAKRKLMKIIPKFLTLSRRQNKSTNNDGRNVDSEFDHDTAKQISRPDDLQDKLTAVENTTKSAKYHIVMKRSNDISQNISENSSAQGNNHIAVESIFQNDFNRESQKSISNSSISTEIKNIEHIPIADLLVISADVENKTESNTFLNSKLLSENVRVASSSKENPLPDIEKVLTKKHSFDSDENVPSVNYDTFPVMDDSDNLSHVPKRWKSINAVHIIIDGHGRENDGEESSAKSSIHNDFGSSPTSSHLKGSLNSSLYSEAENEIQTRTVSLSSETSAASLEMINPKDIQRPKRHKRKRIPDSFMQSQTSNEALSFSNDSLHNDASNSFYSNKNFESVNEVDETTRKCEEYNSEDEKLIVTQPYLIMDKYSNELTEDILDRISDKNKDFDINRTSKLSNSNKTSKLSIIYVEDANEEESTTDPVTPPSEKRLLYTSKVQLTTSEDESLTSKSSITSVSERQRSISITKITPVGTNLDRTPDVFNKDDVIAELKSAIESSDDGSDIQPRILNLKPKEKNDWHYGRPSDYNLILNFKKKSDSPSDSPFNRSASISSYESIENNNNNIFRKSRSSTETSYESAPPPPPDSRPPFPSDGESKASSSVASRQSSFNDNDSVEFVKPKVPAFSISTYQSRASKISYDKKLSRSESLASFQDLQGNNDDSKLVETSKLTRSDSQRNEIFKSDTIKKATSTTFLNQCSTDWNDKVEPTSNIRPSLIKSQFRSSLYEIGPIVTAKEPQNGTIQFDISSSKEPITFNRPLPNTYNNLRKVKSTLDVRGNEGRMGDGFQTIPDSGLANEYMRLQDDFMKWQQQLLQNQQILHNRVAPIASNPPVFNNTGRIGGGLRLGWKTQVPWLVNNMVNPSSSNVTTQPQRKPVEITIPIKFEDSDEETPIETPPRQNFKPAMQNPINQVDPTSGSRWDSPTVPVDSWQERPSFVVKTQPVVIEPHMPRHFDNQPRMQTVFQSTPQDFQSNTYPTPQSTFQPKPQPNFQQPNVRTFQQNSRPEFQQPSQPTSNFQQTPQPNFQRTSRNEVHPVPQSTFQQGSQSRYQQPQPSINQHVVEPNFQPFSEPDTQITTKSYPQYSSRPQPSTTTFVNDNNDDGINARFSSVVTLSNDKNSQNAPQKDKVRSVVQLNNSDNPLANQNSVPFHSKIISSAPKIAEKVEKEIGSFASPVVAPSVAPISSRLVQQAAQQPPSGGFRISPPKIERISPSKVVERSSPPQFERNYAPFVERQQSPPKHEPSPPAVKLRHVEPRISPPRIEVPQPPPAPVAPAPPPPPPPPSSSAAAPPPPPPPPMSEADRRTATGKKIFGAANVPQLDAREELMMAIRQFGGSGNLRKSAYPPPLSS